MDTKNYLHKCKDCRYYNAVYKKYICNFDKTDTGICLLNQKPVKKDSQCKLYKYRIKKSETVTLEHIDIVITDIKELEKIYYTLDY